ncbi:STN and carboxypeptidase regulatory-like domain-containing protein [Chitinophaga sp.]|uniref:STN and carboxypeptidase regulatory-like domain-containing protein n=1 Tax=Chitinophaga sp. TaxID=1869181 RepID=UPI002F94ECF7
MLLSKQLLTLFLGCIFSITVSAQSLLNKTVSVEAKQQPLSAVLISISKQGGFYFSYLTTILPQDSLVTISVKNKTVKQVLDILFTGDYLYKESGNYIILLKKSSGQTYYLISGIVTDKKTGQRLPNASVYERQQLISTLTNSDGYFRLRLKDKYPTAAISVSKDLYADTSLLLTTGYDQEVAVSISPTTYQLKTVDITGHTQVEKTWFGNMFLSSRQKLTSLNIGAFLADKPYQVSLTPGLGTHGRMSGQVVNKFSVNMLGGYAAGVDGVEIGTVFNIVKNDMQHVQLSGMVNVVGGKTKGVQIAGFHNNVLDSMIGVQMSGISNITESSLRGVQITGAIGQVYGNMNGVQLSGITNVTRGNSIGWQVAGAFNYTKGNVEGLQLSGLVNYSQKDAKGAQISGAGNVTHGTMKGLQLGALFNYARQMDGVQIGIVNIADTVNGYSIGIINIVRRGYKKVVLFSTDVLPYNIAWKAGRSELYSILLGGFGTGENNNAWSIGYGIGKNIAFNKVLFLSAEVTAQNTWQGGWDHNTQVYRLQPSLNVKLGKRISLFAGPALSIAVADNENKVNPDHHYINFGTHYPSFNIGSSGKGWLGWQAGISLF